MKKKKVILLVIIVLFLSTNAYAKKVYILKFFVHSHTKGWSDGSVRTPDLIKKVKGAGFRGILFSDHSDMHISDKPDSFWWYQDETQRGKIDNGFVVLTGREITVGPAKDSNNHLNAYSFTSTPFLYDPRLTLDQVLSKVNSEDGSFTIYNHPRTNTRWCSEVWKFSGIELFNDPFGELVDQDCYIRGLQSGWKGFVVSGVDYHSDIINPDWRYTITWIFSESITREGILSALEKSSTIATLNVTRLQTNRAPSKYNYTKAPLRIEINTSKGTPLVYIAYKDGYQYESKELKRASTGNAYYFIFTPIISGCYVFRIPYYMTTSSYCYQ